MINQGDRHLRGVLEMGGINLKKSELNSDSSLARSNRMVIWSLRLEFLFALVLGMCSPCKNFSFVIH